MSSCGIAVGTLSYITVVIKMTDKIYTYYECSLLFIW